MVVVRTREGELKSVRKSDVLPSDVVVRGVSMASGRSLPMSTRETPTPSAEKLFGTAKEREAQIRAFQRGGEAEFQREVQKARTRVEAEERAERIRGETKAQRQAEAERQREIAERRAFEKRQETGFEPFYQDGRLLGFQKGATFIPKGAIPTTAEGVYQLERIGVKPEVQRGLRKTIDITDISTGERIATISRVQGSDKVTFKDVQTGKTFTAKLSREQISQFSEEDRQTIIEAMQRGDKISFTSEGVVITPKRATEVIAEKVAPRVAPVLGLVAPSLPPILGIKGGAEDIEKDITKIVDFVSGRTFEEKYSYPLAMRTKYKGEEIPFEEYGRLTAKQDLVMKRQLEKGYPPLKLFPLAGEQILKLSAKATGTKVSKEQLVELREPIGDILKFGAFAPLLATGGQQLQQALKEEQVRFLAEQKVKDNLLKTDIKFVTKGGRIGGARGYTLVKGKGDLQLGDSIFLGQTGKRVAVFPTGKFTTTKPKIFIGGEQTITKALSSSDDAIKLSEQISRGATGVSPRLILGRGKPTLDIQKFISRSIIETADDISRVGGRTITERGGGIAFEGLIKNILRGKGTEVFFTGGGKQVTSKALGQVISGVSSGLITESEKGASVISSQLGASAKILSSLSKRTSPITNQVLKPKIIQTSGLRFKDVISPRLKTGVSVAVRGKERQKQKLAPLVRTKTLSAQSLKQLPVLREKQLSKLGLKQALGLKTKQLQRQITRIPVGIAFPLPKFPLVPIPPPILPFSFKRGKRERERRLGLTPEKDLIVLSEGFLSKVFGFKPQKITRKQAIRLSRQSTRPLGIRRPPILISDIPRRRRRKKKKK